jgi:hypothetical protein
MDAAPNFYLHLPHDIQNTNIKLASLYVLATYAVI